MPTEGFPLLVLRQVLAAILFAAVETDVSLVPKEGVSSIAVLLASNVTTKRNGTTFMEVFKELSIPCHSN